MGKNLYDYPFEYRIRMKYMMFGFILGLSLIGLGGLISLPVILIMHYSYPEITPNYNAIGMILPFAMFIPFAVWMWYSKAKPRKHSELNETVGLKEDYDRVKNI